MLTVRALQRLVGSKEVPDYPIASDPSSNYGCILCPDQVKVESLHGHYVRIGDEKIFFDVVSNVGYIPFYDDVNQHPRVLNMI